ncbi:uncharacterized protein LOC131329000 isoform X4 [Rhododendron vialii]|uniref:uncharacterized protein LOC131329000 isoform X4 n=1 Tax=Rhododendron vialii TaxID=182163 RepID=UPI0026603407|nr:uncharacterized protein LOC131329000 isoform X4 [Rhododendron vialii]
MASSSNIGRDERSKELYKALMNEDKERVLELCKQFEDGPFHVVTIHADTVLHVATYSMQADLVLQLLEMVTNDQLDKLTFQNKIGNTILHEASTSDSLVEAAKKMLIKAPGLLYKRNQYDVTPLYRSVCYGKIEMFKFLHDEIQTRKDITGEDVEADSEDYYQQKNKTTILHTAVVIESFGYWGVPLWQEKWKQNQRYESALSLAKFLIKKDTSWIATKAVEDWDQTKYHKYGGVDPFSSSSSPEQKIEKQATTPLFLATKFGCVEIVKEILSEYPWAVEYIDHDGRTILHRAIKYREMQILEIVAQMGVPMRRLVRKVDRYNNTILHMVGEKTDDPVVPVVQSPAFQLQDNLLLFERVREICPSHLLNTINMNKKTAQQLFDAENQDLREKAKEWLKSTAENSSIVAILIATVAFAAAYTIPGGPNQSTGLPILLNQPFFVVFTMTDVLSLTFALTSVIIFLRILTSPFRLNDFKQSLPQILMLGVTFLILSVSMMMFAFAATVILMIHTRGQWTKIALYTASFLPVSIFALSYLPLYLSLMKTFKYSLKKVAMIFPHCTGASVLSCVKSFLPKRSRPNKIETPVSTCPPKSQACPNLVEMA